MTLQNKIALVTGASRGIGAAVSRLLAERGADVIVNFRSKEARALEVVKAIAERGRRAIAVQADLTDPAGVRRMLEEVRAHFGRLDVLVLNASGGLEKDKTAAYARALNVEAQLDTLTVALPLMPQGASVVFVTSHWAHFYGTKPVLGSYELIAASKKAGERALVARIPELKARGVRLAIVSGDMIEGTITPKLLERSQPGLMAAQRARTGVLPTVEEFAAAIVEAAVDGTRPSGHVAFVGAVD